MASAETFANDNAADADLERCYLVARMAITLTAAADALEVAEQMVRHTCGRLGVSWDEAVAAQQRRAVEAMRSLAQEAQDAIC